jgi:2',3'-cyclic-nucleotide 2'-phosphodiesterase (5'-nucleotidase family)
MNKRSVFFVVTLLSALLASRSTTCVQAREICTLGHEHVEEDSVEVRQVAAQRVSWRSPETALAAHPNSQLHVKILAINDFHDHLEAEAINCYIPEIKAKGVCTIVALIHQCGRQTNYEGQTDPAAGPIDGAAIVDIVSRLDPEVDVVV